MSEAKYYILKPAVDTPETGSVYPAVESYDDYDFNAPNSVHKISFSEFPDFEPDIRFKLVKGAKLCDLLGQATINSNGFLISERLKNLFQKARLIQHQIYPATIESNNSFHQYYWIQFLWNDGKKLIDFPSSIFFKQKFSNNLGYVKLTSEDDYKRIKNEFGSRYMIGFEKLIFKTIPDFDLLLVPYKTDIFVTNSYKKKLEAEKLTGLSFQPLNWVKLKS